MCLRAAAAARTDRARKLLLIDCIESYLPLTPAEEARFCRLVERPEDRELKAMRKTWSEQLMEKGEKRGEKRGELRGRIAAKRETLLGLIRRKFGPVPPEIEARVEAIDDLARLDDLLARILTAGSLEEMGV